ncbi:MAG TPA: hypothetical protein VK307_01185 [Thermoleophilaceae bacterium]|nr:hypothetical protein [Thermoleophilaceae bacterium]
MRAAVVPVEQLLRPRVIGVEHRIVRDVQLAAIPVRDQERSRRFYEGYFGRVRTRAVSREARWSRAAQGYHGPT